MRIRLLLAWAFVDCVPFASAHPGHGPGEVPPAHLLTNADHLWALLAVGVIGFCLLNVRRWFNRHPKAT